MNEDHDVIGEDEDKDDANSMITNFTKGLSSGISSFLPKKKEGELSRVQKNKIAAIKSFVTNLIERIEVEGNRYWDESVIIKFIEKHEERAITKISRGEQK